MNSKVLSDILVMNINEKVNVLIDDINEKSNVLIDYKTLLGSEWNDFIANAIDVVVENKNPYRYVCDEEPPMNTEILVKEPSGTLHLADWRGGYNVFTCQEKDAKTTDWMWKYV